LYQNCLDAVIPEETGIQFVSECRIKFGMTEREVIYEAANKSKETRMGAVTIDRDENILLIGINRPDAYNLWDLDVIQSVSRAYRMLGDDPELRVGIVYGHGRRFTAGLDLPSVVPAVSSGDVGAVLPPDGYDPWDFLGEPCPKPIVVAAHGTCNTLGIELMLASQVAIAAEGTKFAQLEVARGVFPLGGATFRLPMRLGPPGTRYLLTAERFDVETAFRLGLISEIVPAGKHLERAIELAKIIASNAPLAVQAAIASARAAERASREAARAVLFERNAQIMTSADVAEGVAAMLEKRAPIFHGK
jgi:enoyl-CoA hydratase/carnithine racemase